MALTACAQTPKTYIPANATCAVEDVTFDLEVPFPGGAAGYVPSFFQTVLDDALEPAAPGPGIMEAPPPRPLLFLSGGSQKGAFGAGYLSEWAALHRGRVPADTHHPSGLPKFGVVTGISTGALQSTAAFIGQPDLAVDVARIDAEGELLEVFVGGSPAEGGLGLGAGLSLIDKGAISDLIPLRDKLSKTIDDTVMAAVAAGGAEGRRLFIGVTNYDTGRATGVDLTEIARLHSTAADAETREAYRTCYREFLIASSIVPIAAKPVFIDNRMFIDGGVRLGVVPEQLRFALEKIDPAQTPTPIHIVLNGDGVPTRRCGKVDPKTQCDGTEPRDIDADPHEKWNFLGLALRSVDLLSNQVARLSLDRAANLGRDYPHHVVFDRIVEADIATFSFPSAELTPALRPDAPISQSCEKWRQMDKQLDQPVEFHPRYMQCLIAYGRHVAQERFGDDPA